MANERSYEVLFRCSTAIVDEASSRCVWPKPMRCLKLTEVFFSISLPSQSAALLGECSNPALWHLDIGVLAVGKSKTVHKA